MAVIVAALFMAIKLSPYFYPVATLKQGGNVVIYMDGSYNRTATISKQYSHGFDIYGQLLLPIDYIGKFYAVGYLEDGHKLIYTTNKKHGWIARYAEFVRGCKRKDGNGK